MGFVLKSVFWLGLVYSAMPFDESPSSVAKGSGEWLCQSALAAGPNAPEAYRKTLAAGCIAALAAPKEAAPSAPGTPAAPAYALTDEDRRPPWQGASPAKRPKRRLQSG